MKLTKLKVSMLFYTYMNGRQPYHNNLYESKALLVIGVWLRHLWDKGIVILVIGEAFRRLSAKWSYYFMQV